MPEKTRIRLSRRWPGRLRAVPWLVLLAALACTYVTGSTPGIISRLGAGSSQVIFIAGVITSVVLAFLAWSTIDQKMLGRELRLRAEDALRQSEKKYHLLVDNLKEVVFQTDANGIWQFLNPAWEEITGFAVGESLGRLFLDYVHPDDRGRNMELFQPLIERRKEYCRHEIRYLTKDGGFRWIEVYARLGLDETGGVTGTYGTLTDITDRKRAETDLRESESRYRELWHSTVEGIAIHDQGTIIEVNDAVCRMFGYEPRAIIGRSMLEFVPPADRGPLRERIASPVNGSLETTAVRADGTTISIEVFSKEVHHGGKPARMIALRNISDRRRAEESLRESETRFRQLSEAALEGIAVAENGILVDGNGRLAAMLGFELQEMIGRPVMDFIAPSFREMVRTRIAERYEEGYENVLLRRDGSTLPVETHARTVIWGGKTMRVTVLLDLSDRRRAEDQLQKLSLAVEQSPASIVITDTRGCIEYVNPKFTQVTGYTMEEVAGQNPRILKSGETPPEEYRDLWKTITAGREWRGELHNRRRNGELFWEFASISPVKNKEGMITNFLAVKEDITERKRGEEALRQAQKLNSIGTLAGGIAHDFNNVLGGIIGYTDMSLRYAQKGSVLERNLLKVLKVSDRAKHLIQQILTFSRKISAPRSVTPLKPVVEEVVELLKASIPSSVIIRADVRSQTKPVLADPTKIHEAVLNLSTNAVHAMNRKGTLTIRLHGECLDRVIYGQCGEIPPGEYTVLEVADTGCGMDPATLSKAFEPFFTTKGVGEGTGMGLSVVLGVVQSIGGDIQVETEPGKGTAFRLYLPVTAESDSAIAGKNDLIPFSGTEQVLFVDDEEMLVESAQDLLARLGYRVTGTSNSLDALRHLREDGAKFDILITDQTMPGMSGMDLAREVRSIREDLPVILCTGFSDELSRDRTAALGIKRVVMKPYRYSEIAEVIRDVIDG